VKLLVTCNWDPAGLEKVKSAFPQVEFVDGKTPEDCLAHIGDADVVYGHVSREAFLAAKKLKWIHSFSAGVDWIHGVPELVESDVVVTNTSGGHAATIAEHTIGMLIFMTRGFGFLSNAQQNKVWMRPLEFTPIGLSGRTMGVIGFGRIGKAIARVAHAMDMSIIAVDAHDVERPDYVVNFWLFDELPELLKRADVVVVATPYTPQTRNMIGDKELALMKPTSYLLAISRGDIVDEAALAQALHEGRLAGAALDVQAEEPMSPENPLWDAPNLVITPHCSGFSEQTFSGVTDYLRKNLELYLAGKPLINVVDKRLGY
jgi:phosphoglycerate dehydrogenase-like enzyme